MAKEGFTDIGSSFGYVFRLLDAEPAQLRTVAKQLAITPEGALKIVNDMVNKGYLARKAHSADGRSQWLCLTPRARAAIFVAHNFHVKFEADLAARVGLGTAGAARLALENLATHFGSDGRLSVR